MNIKRLFKKQHNLTISRFEATVIITGINVRKDRQIKNIKRLERRKSEAVEKAGIARYEEMIGNAMHNLDLIEDLERKILKILQK